MRADKALANMEHLAEKVEYIGSNRDFISKVNAGFLSLAVIVALAVLAAGGSAEYDFKAYVDRLKLNLTQSD